METLASIAALPFFALCVWLGFKAVKWKRAANERALVRWHEAEIRNDMRNAAAQKKAAANILRKSGQTP